MFSLQASISNVDFLCKIVEQSNAHRILRKYPSTTTDFRHIPGNNRISYSKEKNTHISNIPCTESLTSIMRSHNAFINMLEHSERYIRISAKRNISKTRTRIICFWTFENVELRFFQLVSKLEVLQRSQARTTLRFLTLSMHAEKVLFGNTRFWSTRGRLGFEQINHFEAKTKMQKRNVVTDFSQY